LVAGHVIPATSGKSLKNVGLPGLLGIAVLVAGALIFQARADRAGKVSRNAVLFGAAALAAVVIVPIVSLGSSKTRLVIGHDRWQVVNGDDEVVAQVPYRNMARLETYQSVVGIEVIGINVTDRKDSETFWGLSYRGSAQYPFDMILQNVFIQSPHVVAERIHQEYWRWRQASSGEAIVFESDSPPAPRPNEVDNLDR
jgi:hypothetical protein